MAKANRKVVAINTESGEKVEYASVRQCALALGMSMPAVQQALLWGGANCGGYRLYDTPDKMRERIAQLEKDIKYVESL